ncbi:hypothetical protein FEP39_05305 [Burkholderia multivorans]|nr:hypothetical protein [Burkholderia multivorans]MDR9059892.1 hypothetical protein [Burkholderia multivorans]MDR9065131.1 hypothetical protein [Burkholderia multivorans]MDR9072050.1 hypothetical protein [Burkholderia multivorans]MDR9078012.1 hypothetical protein [Burkholderia multivorans]
MFSMGLSQNSRPTLEFFHTDGMLERAVQLPLNVAYGLDDKLPEHALWWYHNAMVVEPTFEIVRQLAAFRAAGELFFEPTDDVPALMFRDGAKIDGVPSKALVVG